MAIQEVMASELLSIRERAERTVQNIEQITSNLSDEQLALRQAVDEYGAKRVELFKRELHARGMTWCTYCSDEICSKASAIPESEVGLLLVEGREEYSGGYENSCYGFRDFFRLHRACSKCRERAFDRHGTRGRYNTLAKDQSIFYAFRVEKREDGYYARKFGNWGKLDDKKCELPEPPSQLVEQLAEEWDLPPRIELKSQWPLKDTLVIHERAAMAKTA